MAHTTVPAPGRLKQKDQEFKHSLSYIVSLRPSWATLGKREGGRGKGGRGERERERMAMRKYYYASFSPSYKPFSTAIAEATRTAII